MLENGFVKIYRSLLKWEWYDDINTKVVFLHLLLTVSIEDSKWHGITVKRGSRVSSYAILAKETKLTERQVRTSISHLEMTGELTRYKYPNFTVFTVNNYDKFQQVTGETADQRQGNDKATTGQRQQYKKVKEDKEDNLSFYASESKENVSTFPQNTVPPNREDVQRYAEANGIHTDLQRFFAYYEKTGWKTKSGQPITDWMGTLRYWAERDGKFEKKKESIPECENAAAYRSLIYNIDEYDYE